MLYTGIAPFWSALRGAGGDPRADAAAPGPLWVGRFDLRHERWLAPLVVAADGEPTGSWDVLAAPPGAPDALFFTAFFGVAGRLELASGRAERLPETGLYLGELAPGPDGSLLVARYDGPRGGSVVQLDAAGRVRAEHVLEPPPGLRVAAKSVAYDPVRREIWVNTDLLLPDADAAAGHDARVLGLDGRERLRFAEPELQFMSFAADGTGFFALVDDERLRLRIRPPDAPGAGLLGGLLVPLDDAFPRAFDFVQDVKPAPGGGAVVARWSGRIHLVSRSGRVRTLALPRDASSGGLYYTAVVRDGLLCATLCDDVSVVCVDL